MRFPVQYVRRENLLAEGLANPQLAGVGCGVGCTECGGECQGGMGAIDLNNPMVKYGLIGVAGLVLVGSLLRPNKSDYQKAVDSAREDYRSALAAARKKYPRVGQRAARALPF